MRSGPSAVVTSLLAAIALAVAAAPAVPAHAQTAAPAPASAPVQSYEVVRTYPHDPGAFTQGLFFRDGRLFESTGRYPSTVREVRLEDGVVLRRAELPCACFGEGAVDWGDRMITLTWRNGGGFVWDLATFRPLAVFPYEGEGWGLTRDDRRLIMSDGTAELRFLDPETLVETGRVTVTDGGRPVEHLNELEWVEGEVWANVWQSERIARIDPETGRVTAWLDLTGLSDRLPEGAIADPVDEVLNGVAWDAEGRRLFVTGKHWPLLFEIRPTPLP